MQIIGRCLKSVVILFCRHISWCEWRHGMFAYVGVTAPPVMLRHSVEPRDAWVGRCAASNVDRLDPRGLAPGL